MEKVLRPKPIYDILFKLLEKEFNKDFEAQKLCAGDQIMWYRKDKDLMKKLYNKWLLDNEYVEEI